MLDLFFGFQVNCENKYCHVSTWLSLSGFMKRVFRLGPVIRKVVFFQAGDTDG